jgi:uncharacterized membrane protein YphA (DoxX/SURF4 family)
MSRRTRSIAFTLVVLLIAVPGIADAHEKWFFDASGYPTRWVEVLRFPTPIFIGLTIAATVVAWIWWRARDGRDLIPGPEILGATDAGKTRFYGLVPLILGIQLGVPMLVLGIRGDLFSPNNQLTGVWLYWLGVTQIGVALSLLYGALSRVSAVMLGALWLVGIGVVGLEPMLENLHFFGFAAFFFLTGRGPYSLDRVLNPLLEPGPELARWAMPVLRITTGLSFAMVAFTEKLANPALADAFLKQYNLNFTPWLGIPMPNDLFMQCAGSTELLIGLLIAFGFFPRTMIATAWVFINMTLTVFSWVELVGHLPLYGVMAVLLVWTPKDERLFEAGVLGRER